MIARDDATQRQVIAADPTSSTWLSANAGSGKTRVLTDRVARLLLEGVDPQKILCLTYTKAAASEMQNRLFNRLGAWAMKTSDALERELRELGVERPLSETELRHARTLFARAIETPGGLKIQTIHSFCASLLRRFPLEAEVSPQFVEMDDRAAKRVREDIVEGMADGPDVGLVDGLAAYYTGEDFDRLTREITGHRDALRGVGDAALPGVFGLSPDMSEAALQAQVFTGGEETLLRGLIAAMDQGSSTDLKNAAKLSALLGRPLEISDLPVLEGVFLTGAGAKLPFSAKIGSVPTKSTQKLMPDLMPDLDALMVRLEEARDIRLSLAALDKTRALHAFALRYLDLYEAAKLARGWLDFDDLILKARALLRDSRVAAWVLYRLDGGIDHILVDEAQDTSPTQWDVIDALAQEFTSGHGARDEARTIFVVGDKKQSIYSFQGADPAGFDRMRDHFKERLEQIEEPFQNLELLHSFRSAPDILKVVDLTLNGKDGVGQTIHAAFKMNMPGRVDVWPVIGKTEAPEDSAWFDPVDQIAENHETVILARRVAQNIRGMLNGGASLPDGAGFREVTPGDVLILVQRRSDLFHEIIRACKEEGLDIAGADRLKIGAELAVKDLTSLLAFLALPEDDLALAEALKSPLFSWDEQRLFDLAHRRKPGQFLWAALRESASEHPADFAVLADLRKQSDFLRPYDLIERVLTRHQGRHNLLARLGQEAEDGIDALLSQAMAFERLDVPSLTGFLSWLQTEEVEIKRQMDSASDRIRVMTVHGAKGLEAPIVILPDTGARAVTVRDELLAGTETVFWKTKADEMPQVMGDLLGQMKGKLEEERQRLLYVAMTRAEAWLVICAAGDIGKDGKSWHDQISRAVEEAGAVDVEADWGIFRRYQVQQWENAATPQAKTVSVAAELPDWVTVPAAPEDITALAVSPSNLGGAKALQAFSDQADEDASMRRGTLIHLLLEMLPESPQDQWPENAAHLLTTGEERAEAGEVTALLAEAQAVLTNPDLAFLFAGDTMAEVPISADIPQLGRRMHGIIDRLLIEDDRVLIVDFKSNVLVPETESQTPEGIKRQMGAYCAALEQVFPGRRIETAVLWTRTAALMPLTHETVMAALQRAARVDVLGGQT